MRRSYVYSTRRNGVSVRAGAVMWVFVLTSILTGVLVYSFSH